MNGHVQGVMSHAARSHVTHIKESCHTHEWVQWRGGGGRQCSRASNSVCRSGAAGREGQGEAGGRRLSERFSKSALSVGTLSPAALLTHSHHTQIHTPQDGIGKTDERQGSTQGKTDERQGTHKTDERQGSTQDATTCMSAHLSLPTYPVTIEIASHYLLSVSIFHTHASVSIFHRFASVSIFRGTWC